MADDILIPSVVGDILTPSVVRQTPSVVDDVLIASVVGDILTPSVVRHTPVWHAAVLEEITKGRFPFSIGAHVAHKIALLVCVCVLSLIHI